MLRALLLGLTAVAAPVSAASYAAAPAAPATERFIARDIVWTCGASGCSGRTDESRPAVLCQSLARHAGRLDSFLVDGAPFSTAELAKCNAAAKGNSGKAVAAQ